MPPDRPEVVRRTDCRVCRSSDLEAILSLGPTPLANAFLRGPEEFPVERTYPLDLSFCRGCGLLQLLDVVDPEILFRDYIYVTGTSSTQTAHAREYAASVADLLKLGPGDLVAEVASNDGTFLRAFAAHGVRTLGIEPARNIAAEATASGIDTVNEFFTRELGARLRAERGAARVVVANNVLAHVDDPADLLAGCRELLADDGMIVVEVPYVGDMLDRVEYDTIYHEHLSYFAIAPLLRLAERVGLRIVRIDRVAVHGGSLRVYFSRPATAHAPGVLELASEERGRGVVDPARAHRFAADVDASRAALVELLTRLASEGSEVAGYGAPAKGNTLLNFCGIDSRLIRYTVDRNPRKVGLFTPGMHIPVRPVSALAAGAQRPDYLLVLAWNIADEIIQQQHEYRARGGRFIVPVPRARVM
jgi:SAM-dependent methyltransferase